MEGAFTATVPFEDYPVLIKFTNNEYQFIRSQFDRLKYNLPYTVVVKHAEPEHLALFEKAPKPSVSDVLVPQYPMEQEQPVSAPDNSEPKYWLDQYLADKSKVDFNVFISFIAEDIRKTQRGESIHGKGVQLIKTLRYAIAKSVKVDTDKQTKSVCPDVIVANLITLMGVNDIQSMIGNDINGPSKEKILIDLNTPHHAEPVFIPIYTPSVTQNRYLVDYTNATGEAHVFITYSETALEAGVQFLKSEHFIKDVTKIVSISGVEEIPTNIGVGSKNYVVEFRPYNEAKIKICYFRSDLESVGDVQEEFMKSPIGSNCVVYSVKLLVRNKGY